MRRVLLARAAFLGYALGATLKHLLKRRLPIVPQRSKTGGYGRPSRYQR
jgi:hypothetical protein